MSQHTEREQLYLTAKEAYYEGNPILLDSEFDALEEELRVLGSKVVLNVGSFDRNANTKHPSWIGSLSKISFKFDKDPEALEDLSKWLHGRLRLGASRFEVTPKFDGNSMNLVYKNGQLVHAISRGDGIEGRDQIEKVSVFVPNFIDEAGTIEVRGEVMIRRSVFDAKYPIFKNPRNFVAGVLNRDTVDRSTLMDLEFIPYDVKIHVGDFVEYPDDTLEYLKFLGFILNYPTVLLSSTWGVESLNKVYDMFLDYRRTGDYLLDGMVIKCNEEIRDRLGNNGHSPNWAVAIKFPPNVVASTVLDILWSPGKTGALYPVIELEPVMLDGSEVSRASGHNYQYVLDNALVPGAIVRVAKMGDIIPQVIKVEKPGISDLHGTIRCSSCGHAKYELRSVHIYCINPKCEGQTFTKFSSGIKCLGIERIGSGVAKKLWEAGFTSPFQLLDPDIMNESVLDTVGLKKSRSTEIIIEECRKVNKIEAWKILYAMQYIGVGKTVSQQAVKQLIGQSPDWTGLDRSIVERVKEGGDIWNEFVDLYHTISDYEGVNITLPEIKDTSEMKGTYILTGKPTTHTTKAEFNKWITQYGYEEITSMKSANYLIAEDANGNSTKLKNARKAGVNVVTYQEVYDILSSGGQLQ